MVASFRPKKGTLCWQDQTWQRDQDYAGRRRERIACWLRVGKGQPPRAKASHPRAAKRAGASQRTRPTEAAAERISRRQGLRQQALPRLVALEGDQAYHPSLRSSRPQAYQEGAPLEGWPGLRGALEGGAHLCLAGQLSTAVGASRAPPLHLPRILPDRLHPLIVEIFLNLTPIVRGCLRWLVGWAFLWFAG